MDDMSLLYNKAVSKRVSKGELLELLEQNHLGLSVFVVNNPAADADVYAAALDGALDALPKAGKVVRNLIVPLAAAVASKADIDRRVVRQIIEISAFRIKKKPMSPGLAKTLYRNPKLVELGLGELVKHFIAKDASGLIVTHEETEEARRQAHELGLDWFEERVCA